jgi:hypothetical protein
MSEESVVRDLFDRWKRVWHEGQYDLAAECVAQVYTRHVYDHEIAGDRAWFRFTLMWTDASTGETRTRTGMQGLEHHPRPLPRPGPHRRLDRRVRPGVMVPGCTWL